MKKLINGLLLVCAMGAFTFACSGGKESTEEQTDMATETAGEGDLQTITVNVISKSNSELKGTAIFKEMSNGNILLEVNLLNITAGDHAVHLHETGDCTADDGSSAGGHWNPMGVAHGNRATDANFHQGDIGNLVVGEDGGGSLSMEIEGWTVGGPDETNILNKAVIVHAGPDDFTSQPSGAAGPRIGCGVIKNG